MIGCLEDLVDHFLSNGKIEDNLGIVAEILSIIYTE